MGNIFIVVAESSEGLKREFFLPHICQTTDIPQGRKDGVKNGGGGDIINNASLSSFIPNLKWVVVKSLKWRTNIIS